MMVASCSVGRDGERCSQGRTCSRVHMLFEIAGMLYCCGLIRIEYFLNPFLVNMNWRRCGDRCAVPTANGKYGSYKSF